MTSVDEAVIARYKFKNLNFEILVDCEKALEFRQGKASLDDALVTTDVFSDVKKGEHAKEADLKTAFKTSDYRQVCEHIIKHGEIQLTQEHRDKMREEIRRKIVNLIHRNAIDSKTGLPHPPQRIELAMEQAKVRIDEFKKAEEQLHEVVEKLRPILPIKFEVREVAVKVPAKFTSQSYHILKKFGTILRDEWQNDGSLVCLLEMPSGLSEEFEDELNKLTHGEAELKVVSRRG
ncbi:MAG: ribosome assembly factor SBDS [Candidatus Nanoarchaeia archaeon]